MSRKSVQYIYDREELVNRIDELKSELKEAEERLNLFDNFSQEQSLAIELHTLLCHYNHTDGCAWMYHNLADPHVWNSNPHKRYLEMARDLLKQVPYDQALKVAKTLSRR